MAFVCHLPDGAVVNVDDLPFEEWDVIATKAGAPWYEVYGAPVANPAGAVALVAACARYVGQEPPSAGWLTAGNVLKVFQRVDEDLPGSYEDGIPKPGGDQGTTTSSGSPTDTAGPLPSSEVNPSGISDS